MTDILSTERAKLLDRTLPNVNINILLYMEHHKIKQSDLASIFKVSKSTISKYLNGSIDIKDFLKQFSKLYNIKSTLFKILPDYFIKYLDEKISVNQALTLSKNDIKLNYLNNNNKEFKDIIDAHDITVLANEETRTVIDEFKNEIIGLKEQLKRSENKTDTLQVEVSELKQLIIKLLNKN